MNGNLREWVYVVKTSYLYASLSRDRRVKVRSLRLVWPVARVRRKKNVHKTLEKKRLGARLLRIQSGKYYDLDMDLKKKNCEDWGGRK